MTTQSRTQAMVERLSKALAPQLCRLPEALRSLFYKTLDHRWSNTFIAEDASACEQRCARCGAFRHYAKAQFYPSRLTVQWRPGKLHALLRPVSRENRGLEVAPAPAGET